MMGSWWAAEGWGMGFGFIFMILFWVLIAAGVVAVIRSALQSPGGGHGSGSREKAPIEIVRERYARGEIGREEFQLLKRDLET